MVTYFKLGCALMNKQSGTAPGSGIWLIFGLMYIFTSDTVEPFGKLEFFWRMLAGPFNFLPGV